MAGITTVALAVVIDRRPAGSARSFAPRAARSPHGPRPITGLHSVLIVRRRLLGVVVFGVFDQAQQPSHIIDLDDFTIDADAVRT